MIKMSQVGATGGSVFCSTSSPDVLFENVSFGQVEEKMRQYETDLAELATCCGFSLPVT